MSKQMGGAKRATTTIPIVRANSADPMGEGVIASLARPGGNTTGNASLSPQLNTKELEVLKDAVSRLDRVGLLRLPGNIIGKTFNSKGSGSRLKH
jgi:putative ABC transport system substrate-binding protein